MPPPLSAWSHTPTPGVTAPPVAGQTLLPHPNQSGPRWIQMDRRAHHRKVIASLRFHHHRLIAALDEVAEGALQGQGFGGEGAGGLDGAGVFVAQCVKAGGGQGCFLPRRRFTSLPQVLESKSARARSLQLCLSMYFHSQPVEHFVRPFAGASCGEGLFRPRYCP